MSPINDQDLRARVADLAEKQLAIEHASGESLGSRGTALSGFIGVVLAVTSALAGQAPKHLGAVGEPVFLVLFVAAVSLLVCAAALSVLVVAPRLRPLLNPNVLRRYATQGTDVPTVNEHFARRTIELLEEEAAINNARARRLASAFRLLLAGLAAAAGQAIVIAAARFSGL
ncbi:MAG: hypothetical protein M3076_21175 [Actinomycetota bacterium]|nr:hypothetical protein [Actinomycetota bacterium]